MAAFVDRLEDVPMRPLAGGRPVQLSPKDLDEVGILGKHCGKADAVVTIPRGFDLLQDSMDDLLICCHDCPPEIAEVSDLHVPEEFSSCSSPTSTIEQIARSILPHANL